MLAVFATGEIAAARSNCAAAICLVARRAIDASTTAADLLVYGLERQLCCFESYFEWEENVIH